MFKPFQKIIRRKALKKYAQTEPTGLLPLKSIHSAAVVLDVEFPGFEQCKKDSANFFAEKGIKVDTFFLDLRKLEKDEMLLTSIRNTIIRKDIGFYGMPRKDSIIMEGKSYDLLLCLTPKADFTALFIARYIKAKFKIGAVELPGNVFDMVVSGENVSGIFSTVKTYLTSIV